MKRPQTQAISFFEIPACRFCRIRVPSTTLVEIFKSVWICNSLPNSHPAAENLLFKKKFTDPDKVCWYAPEIGANTFAFSIRTACVHSSQSPSVALKGGGGGGVMQWPHNPIWKPVCLHCNHICWMVANLPQKRKGIAKKQSFQSKKVNSLHLERLKLGASEREMRELKKLTLSSSRRRRHQNLGAIEGDEWFWKN